MVFIGTVAFSDHDPALGTQQRTLVKFKVEEAFKGIAPGVQEIWVDPGSFTSCYAEYTAGERLLVFASIGRLPMPPGPSLMFAAPDPSKQKPLPRDFNREMPPAVYSAPVCSGTRLMREADSKLNAEIEYLRQYKDGAAKTSVRGRVTEDAHFGIFDPPGLPGVNITLTGGGINRVATTDRDGFYVFTDTPPGTYTVTPSLSPYVAGWPERDVEVPLAGCGAADFDMIAPGIIEGTLLDRNARPAAHVRVDVLRLDRDKKPIFYGEKEAITNRDGRYHFNELPSGDFQVGVRLFHPPDVETPYPPTKWTVGSDSVVHLIPGEHKQISPFRLPPPLTVRKIVAEVYWPDGWPAQGVDVWAQVGDEPAASGETDMDGVAQFHVLQGVHYAVEAKIWIGTLGQREVARSGATDLTPGQEPIRLKLILSKRTKEYR